MVSVVLVEVTELSAPLTVVPTLLTELCILFNALEVLDIELVNELRARAVPLPKLILVLPVTSVMALFIAEINLEPTRLLTAPVLALAIPGVTVSPPLPMQHASPGRRQPLLSTEIRPLEKPPGIMTVVQQLLSLMFLPVLVVELMKA